MNQPSAFITRLPLQTSPVLHLVFPGLDDGYAVVFEAHFPNRTRSEVEALLDLVVRELPKVKKQ